MPNKKIQSLTVQGVTYDIVDNTSGYTSNTGTITSVKTTAGAHTTINVSSGAANFNVPTKTSHLTNDSGFLTSYTETDPTVPSWAKASTKPSYTFSEINSTPTTISGYGITNAYTKTEIDGLVAGVLHYKGTKASVANLPTTGNTTGDVWHITADGSEYAWDGSIWQELGTAVDLSGYATKATTLAGYEISDARIENGTITLGSNSITPLTSFTETDPVFTASPAHGISAQDITNWNGKVNKSGDTMTGNLTLYVASGDSPAIIFQRGTLTDNYNDWKIYDKSGFLYFAQRGSGSSDFADMGYFNTSGQAYFHVPWSYIDGKPNIVNTITTTAGAHTAITNATGNVSFQVPTNTSHLTNDSGYITSADLPEGPLIGNTSDITPTQVLTALQAGRDVYITYSHELYGTIAATYFDYSNAFSVIISNVITAYYDDGQTTYMLFQLSGYLNNNTWGCHVTTLAEKSDIPSVPTIALSSTTGITASTTATKTTLGTADSVIGVQSSTTTASKVTLSGSNSFSASVSNHVLSFSHGAQTVSASDVVVPIKDTGATSIPNVSVESATVTITDPGHTHQLSN